MFTIFCWCDAENLHSGTLYVYNMFKQILERFQRGEKGLKPRFSERNGTTLRIHAESSLALLYSGWSIIPQYYERLLNLIGLLQQEVKNIFRNSKNIAELIKMNCQTSGNELLNILRTLLATAVSYQRIVFNILLAPIPGIQGKNTKRRN